MSLCVVRNQELTNEMKQFYAESSKSMDASVKEMLMRFHGQQTKLNDHQQRLLDLVERIEWHKEEFTASEKKVNDAMLSRVETVQAAVGHLESDIE